MKSVIQCCATAGCFKETVSYSWSLLWTLENLIVPSWFVRSARAWR